MPELPEVEITARLIGAAVAGATVESALAPGINALKTYDPPLNAIDGRAIAGIRRRGKLFLIHGDMDDNVSPANTLRLADALIKAGKTFDMLIIPDAAHQLYLLPYVHRVHWDFFVRNLLGVEPPNEYLIKSKSDPRNGGQ